MTSYKIPLADPTSDTPLSKADAAILFVVSTVVLIVLAILSMCETNNATLIIRARTKYLVTAQLLHQLIYRLYI